MVIVNSLLWQGDVDLVLSTSLDKEDSRFVFCGVKKLSLKVGRSEIEEFLLVKAFAFLCFFVCGANGDEFKTFELEDW